MSGKSKVPRKTAKSPAKPAASGPIRMFVRRGALKRFDDLKRKTAHLQVEVLWDRREDEDRRQEPCLSDSERRARDRRGEPPFTWNVADFVVVTPQNQRSEASKSQPAVPRVKKPR